MTLTKADLVNLVHAEHDLTKMQSIDAVEKFLEITKSCLENGQDLLLPKFGKFSVKKKSARKGRNPKTGEGLLLDARTIVTFKPSGQLRDRVNSG